MINVKQLREKLDQLERTFSPETIDVLGKFEDQGCYVLVDTGVVGIENVTYTCEFGLMLEPEKLLANFGPPKKEKC